MTTEVDCFIIEANKARKSVIGNSIGFAVGILVTILTMLSPSPIFLLAWGAIVFCPIAAVRSYMRYRKLKAALSA